MRGFEQEVQHFPNEIGLRSQIVLVVGLHEITREVFGADGAVSCHQRGFEVSPVALDRPVFGWGGWGRSRLHDDQGRDVSVTDGLCIISAGPERARWPLLDDDGAVDAHGAGIATPAAADVVAAGVGTVHRTGLGADTLLH